MGGYSEKFAATLGVTDFHLRCPTLRGCTHAKCKYVITRVLGSEASVRLHEEHVSSGLCHASSFQRDVQTSGRV